MAIKVATDATFEELVLHSEIPVVVDFWATWCGPCKMVAPEMEKLASKYEGAVDVVKVDVDANPGLSQAFQIMSIPTIAFFQPGKQPQGVVGFRPLEQLEQQFGLAQFTPPPAAAAVASTEASGTGELTGTTEVTGATAETSSNGGSQPASEATETVAEASNPN